LLIERSDEDKSMTPDRFLKRYESATNSRDFNNVRPLIAHDAVYFFSNENLHGIAAIEKAFVDTFNTIKDETYSIHSVQWLAVSDTVAVCVYDFHWRGTIDGERREGSGRGTNALVKRNGEWVMIHEHLSRPGG
jgi:ketosteroid isomerase-like protein